MKKQIDPYKIENVNFSLIKEEDARFKEYKAQRLDRGFDDSELWSLDCTFAKFIAPRIRRLKEVSGDFPADLTRAKWEQILDEMAEGFEIYPEHFHWTESEQEANWKKVHKALSNFHKYFFNLWY